MTSDPRLRRRQATATPPVPPPPPPDPEPDIMRMGLDGASDDVMPQQQQNGNKQEEDGFKLRFCTVCASNNNRYVEIWSTSMNVIMGENCQKVSLNQDQDSLRQVLHIHTKMNIIVFQTTSPIRLSGFIENPCPTPPLHIFPAYHPRH